MAGAAGDRSGLPWASLLDPVANARALGDIQAQALRAAGDLVERLAAAAEENRLSGAPSRGPRPDDPAATNGDAARLVDAWIEMLRRVSTQIVGTAPPGADRERAEIDIRGGSSGPGVRLVVNESGEEPSGGAEVWLHNGTTTVFGPLRLRVDGLWSPGGALLDATIECDPSCVDELPPRSSRGIVLSIARNGGGAALPAGIFRGVLQVDGAADVWLPIEVVVTGPGS